MPKRITYDPYRDFVVFNFHPPAQNGKGLPDTSMDMTIPQIESFIKKIVRERRKYPSANEWAKSLDMYRNALKAWRKAFPLEAAARNRAMQEAKKNSVPDPSLRAGNVEV